MTLQFISHHNSRLGYADGCRMALEGGCRWIQLRMKGATDDEVRPVALEVQQMWREKGATFIIDDGVQLVRELGADGVHLGKNDMPIDQARQILGTSFIIGGTANTIDDVRAHAHNGADYIGCGPFRFTTTKEKLSPVLGLDGYRRIIAQMKKEDIRLPLIAIGGITLDDIPQLMQTGIDGIALSGAIMNDDLPVDMTRHLLALMEECHITDNK